MDWKGKEMSKSFLQDHLLPAPIQSTIFLKYNFDYPESSINLSQRLLPKLGDNLARYIWPYSNEEGDLGLLSH